MKRKIYINNEKEEKLLNKNCAKMSIYAKVTACVAFVQKCGFLTLTAEFHLLTNNKLIFFFHCQNNCSD